MSAWDSRRSIQKSRRDADAPLNVWRNDGGGEGWRERRKMDKERSVRWSREGVARRTLRSDSWQQGGV